MNTYDNASRQFLTGEVDAWVGSYPFLSSVEQQVKVRSLIPTEGLFTHRSLWFASREFATTRTAELQAIVDALQESDRWIQENYTEAAKLFADYDTGDGASDLPAWEHALRTRPWGQYPVTEEFIAEQQHAADLFHANGLIERDIRVQRRGPPVRQRARDRQPPGRLGVSRGLLPAVEDMMDRCVQRDVHNGPSSSQSARPAVQRRPKCRVIGRDSGGG